VLIARAEDAAARSTMVIKIAFGIDFPPGVPPKVLSGIGGLAMIKFSLSQAAPEKREGMGVPSRVTLEFTLKYEGDDQSVDDQ
jgi:hypothetical protein